MSALTDDEYKLVYSRLGDRMRIAGTARVQPAYSDRLNVTRARVARVRLFMPEAVHWDARLIAGAGAAKRRRASVPYVGNERYSESVFEYWPTVPLGWTAMKCESGGPAAGGIFIRREATAR